MKLFRWIKGRQSLYCGNLYYEKLKIFQVFRSDCYLIRYSEGLAIGYHTDEVPGYSHWRLNLQIIGINRLCLWEEFNRKMKRICLFRADKLHSFGITLERGLILSFGIAFKNRMELAE